MRVLTIVGVALGGAVTALSAQHAHQLELGAFGTYTHFDSYWGLNGAIGGGGRLGYFLNDFIGFEVTGDVASPNLTAGGAGPSMTNLGVNVVLNSGGERNILYVLGGYVSNKMGSGSLNSVRGAIGDRIFFSNRVGLRIEGGVLYSPNQKGIGASLLNFQGSAGLSLLLGGSSGEAAPEMSKQKRDSIIAAGGTVPETPTRQIFVERGVQWPYQWFWGAEAGLMFFKTAFDGVSAEPTFGGHWLITAKRSAMYVGYDQAFFISDRHATITEPSGTVEPGNVAFNSLRRIMIGLLAFPVQHAIQPFGGAGFAIMEIPGSNITCTNCTLADATIVQNEASDMSTKAFFWWMGGIDVHQGRLSLYGHYILTTHTSNFLIDGVTHTFQGGLRYSLGSSREDENPDR
ncbi:MAG TPA: hypothetical protein VN848_01855 [Gemmatimonadales bacterium]|nr:hypothetical protein [Gemmatimonadales bacterium]